MANEVKLKLSMEGGKVVAAEIDGVTASLNQTGSAARKAATDLQPTTQSVDKLGVSAKQTAAALRGVPAQFTDIITSLQGGQAPLTVFMQQGGQLKDMFGGAGNAAKALGGYVLGLINPFTIAAAAAGGLAYAWYVGAAEGQAYTRSIILSGNAAGVTSREMAAMAQNIGATTQATVGAAAEAVAAFVGNGNIAADQIARFSSLAVAMERETGQSVKKTAELFEDLGKKPVEASVKLNETTHYLTLSVYEQIKALEQQGRAVDAAALAQSAYADAMEQRMPKLTENLGYVERAWRRIIGGAKSAWDAMLGVGRQADPVAELQKAIAVREGYVRDNRTGALPTDDAKLNALRQELTYLGETERMTRRVAAEQADANKTVQEKIEFDKRGNAFLSDKVKLQNALNKEIESGRELLASGAITAKQYADRLNDVQASFAKKGAAAPLSEAAKGLDLYNDLLDIGSGYTATYAEDQRKLAAAFKSGLIPSYAQYTAAVEILMARQPRMIAATKAEEAARKGLNEAIQGGLQAQKNATEEDVKYLKVRQELLQVAQDGEDSLQFEISLMGLSAAGRQQAIEQYRIMAELKKRLADIDANAYYQANPEARAAAIADAQIAAATRAATASGRVTLDAWNKTYDEISTGLTDAIMSAGKDGGKGLRDFLEAELLTKPFKMVVQAMIQPLAQGLTNLVMGQGGAGGGMLGLLSNAGGLGNLANMASVGYAGGVGAGVSALFGTTAGNAAIGTALTGSASMSAAAATAAAEAAGASAAAAGSAASMGATFAAAVPWVAGALAIGSLLFADHGTPTQSTGDGGASFDASGKLTGVSQSFSGINGNVTSVLAGLQQSYAKTAGDLGIGTVATNFAYGGNTGKDSASPNFALGVSAGGRSYNTGETPLNDSALQLAASRAVLTALQGSELPDYLEGAFDGLTPSTMTQDQINQTLTSAKSVKSFHEAVQDLPFDSVKNLSYGATIALGEASGGLGTLQQSLTNMATASTAAKAGINALVSGIKDSVHTTLWDMQYGMADNKGKYGMLDVRGATLDQQMRSATDINDVAKFGNLEIANIKQSWGLLSAEQQAASYAQYEKILTGIEDYMTEKGADALALQQAKDDKTAATIAAAVKTAVAEAMTKPGQQITDAAALLNTASDKPAVAEVTLIVSVPPGIEVATGGNHR